MVKVKQQNKTNASHIHKDHTCTSRLCCIPALFIYFLHFAEVIYC